jgi:hypothetical protein
LAKPHRMSSEVFKNNIKLNEGCTILSTLIWLLLLYFEYF